MTIISKPLHKAAIKDPLRTDLQRIHFYQGRILVTNAHVGISLNANDYFSVTEIGHLDGRSISADDFRKYIWRNEVTFDVESLSFTSGRMKLATEVVKCKSLPLLYQYLHFPEGEPEELSTIGVDLRYITLVASVLKWSNYATKLTFYGKNKAIHMAYVNSGDKAIIMPSMLTMDKKPPKAIDELAKTRQALHYCRTVINSIKPHQPDQKQAIHIATDALGY